MNELSPITMKDIATDLGVSVATVSRALKDSPRISLEQRERIKEELKNGKTIRSSIDSGFSRAFTAIFDSNITTLIAAVVLYFFGSGTVVGFAMTLGIGVVISMFTALTVTHFLLNRLVDFKIRNPKLYGA